MKNCPTCGSKVVTRKKRFAGGGDAQPDVVEDTPTENALPPTGDAPVEDSSPKELDLPLGTATPPPPDQDTESDEPPQSQEQQDLADQYGTGNPPPEDDAESAPLVDDAGPEDDTLGKADKNMFGDHPEEPDSYEQALPPPPPPPVPTPDYMNQQDLGFAADLGNGTIKPETYHDWYEKKGTLGKIGTIFGLLLSGAGSGLAHQPNALLDMMNKEIERDLDAQKTSNVNKQNWYGLAMKHEMQNATISRMNYENAYTQALTGKVPFENAQLASSVNSNLAAAYQHAVEGDLTRGKIKTLGGGAFDLAASNSARNKMMLGATQYIQDIVNALPPGAQKAAGQATLDGQVKPAVVGAVQTNNAKTGAQLNLATNGGKSAGPTIDADAYGAHLQQYSQNQKQLKDAQAAANGSAPQGAINYKSLNDMVSDTRNRAALGLPPQKGYPTEGDLANINKEAQGVEDNRVAAKAYNHAFTKLNNLWDRGLLNPQAYQAEVGTLGPQIARETAGRFNMNEAQTQLGGLFPSWQDYYSTMTGAGNTATEKYQNGMRYFQGNEKGTSTLNRFPQLKTQFPSYPSPFKKAPMTDDAAMKWAQAHPNDPQAKVIMQMNQKKKK